MRQLLTVAGIVFATGCTAPAAEGGDVESPTAESSARTPAAAEGGELKDLKWGMTAAEVISTLDSRARIQKGAFEHDGWLGAESIEVFDGETVPVQFYFDEDGKLVTYRIEFSGGYQTCELRRAKFGEVYGAPFHTSGGFGTGWVTSVWYLPDLPGQAELFSLGEDEDASCKLTFMNEMARNARDAQGLTRNEGDPTPRPDYRPYRPTTAPAA